MSFKSPIGFNEKINYLKINDDYEIKSDLQDKLKVKNHVANLIGEEYIVKTLKILDINSSFKEQLVDFKTFVIKTNFESGKVYFCENKSNFDFDNVQQKILKSYSEKFYMHGREFHYKRIEKQTFAEELLIDYRNLLDYKFYCFDGIPHFVHIDRDRYQSHKRSFYDMSFKKINNLSIEYEYDKIQFKKPNNFNAMVEICHKLSKGFKFVRIDLYDHNDKVYFGEVTFYPESGFGRFSEKKYDIIFGNLIKL